MSQYIIVGCGDGRLIGIVTLARGEKMENLDFNHIQFSPIVLNPFYDKHSDGTTLVKEKEGTALTKKISVPRPTLKKETLLLKKEGRICGDDKGWSNLIKKRGGSFSYVIEGRSSSFKKIGENTSTKRKEKAYLVKNGGGDYLAKKEGGTSSLTERLVGTNLAMKNKEITSIKEKERVASTKNKETAVIPNEKGDALLKNSIKIEILKEETSLTDYFTFLDKFKHREFCDPVLNQQGRKGRMRWVKCRGCGHLCSINEFGRHLTGIRSKCGIREEREGVKKMRCQMCSKLINSYEIQEHIRIFHRTDPKKRIPAKIVDELGRSRDASETVDIVGGKGLPTRNQEVHHAEAKPNRVKVSLLKISLAVSRLSRGEVYFKQRGRELHGQEVVGNLEPGHVIDMCILV